jgi:competence protein ComEC
MSAQVAVAPLLLLWFGSVPLMAPVTNLVAAPVVSASTAFGGIGAVFGIDWFVTVGTGLAAVVLAIARTAADLPQLGVAATGVLSIVGLIAIRARWIRPLVAFGVALAVVIAVAPPGRPAEATVHFLDVGQGDATLFTGPSGEAILIDGGPDPEGEGGPFDEVVAEVRASGSPVAIPEPGDEVVIGSLRVRVVAPQRRYANPNDGSVVVIVSEPSGATVVMSGDIEVPAQREVGLLLGDVMKVPHQGAATSDLEWLDRSAPRVAVISVGPNDYGHPSDEVIATLERAGAIVLRTDRDGTVSLPMAEAVRAATALASGT